MSTASNDLFDAVSNFLIGALAIVAVILVPGVGAALIAGGATLVAGKYVASVIENTWLPETFYLPIYAISPEEIFKNKIALLDVNFFNPNPYEEIETVGGDTSTRGTTSTAAQLQGVISSWYLALRNFALIALLSMLLYVGIKIIMSSTAQDKAKYKEKLYNWLVAVCLLFFMHYIMAFATTIVEAISEGINKVNEPIIMQLPDLKDYYIEVRQKNEDTNEVETGKMDANKFFEEAHLKDDQGQLIWPTNLMGQVRLDMQWEPDEYTDDNLLLRKIGYTFLYLVLVFYTVGFLIMYIKRVIMLAFLTMMAPLVAMTYPLDKMKDGNAQAFNAWLKEYVFNLLIQPLHLILYTMLVGSAIEFAKDNIIYAVVALGFILQAEKIMRKFFGFDKASTVESGSTAALGGALAMNAVSQIKRLGGGAKKASAKSGASDSNNKGKEKIRTADNGKGLNALLSGSNANSSNGSMDNSNGNIDNSNGNIDSVQDENNSELPEDRQQITPPTPRAATVTDGQTRYNDRKSAEWNRMNQAINSKSEAKRS